MKREKSFREFNIDRIRWDYGMYAEMWEQEHDDRRVFSNTYYQIIEALESLPAEPPAWVCVAVIDKMKQDEERLDHILGKYRDGLWGEPVDFPLRVKLKRWPGIMKTTVAV